MKIKFHSLLFFIPLLLTSCSSKGVIREVVATGNQDPIVQRGGWCETGGHFSIMVKIDSSSEFIGKNCRHQITYEKKTICTKDIVLQESYTFNFDYNFDYYNGIDQSQTHILNICFEDKNIGTYEYKVSVPVNWYN